MVEVKLLDMTYYKIEKMFMNTNERNINLAISNLIADFKNYPNKYLTESDVKCILVNELMKIAEFNEVQATEDGLKSVPVHTEVRWYGRSGELKLRSDIVIIDVSTLKVKDGIFKLPSKGFGFNQPKAIIEIKLRRINGDSRSNFIKKINKDINRFNKIRKGIAGNYFCCLIILDKKDDIEQDIPREHNNLNIYYQHQKAT